LKKQVEYGEFAGQQQELPIRRRGVGAAIIAEVRHDVDDTGWHKSDDRSLYRKEPRVRGGETGVANHHADIAEKDDSTDDSDKHQIR